MVSCVTPAIVTVPGLYGSHAWQGPVAVALVIASKDAHVYAVRQSQVHASKDAHVIAIVPPQVHARKDALRDAVRQSQVHACKDAHIHAITGICNQAINGSCFACTHTQGGKQASAHKQKHFMHSMTQSCCCKMQGL